MAKVGRNDPCPCGSGKKYKKCCLAKDEQQSREARGRVVEEALEAMANLPQLPLRSPEQVVEDELWNRFEAADYEGRIAIFLETLEAGKMDEERAFEMLSDIREESKDEVRQEQFRQLVARLERDAPDAYESKAYYFNGWMLEDAIIRGEMSRVPALLEVLGRNLDRSIDVFFQAIDQMMYYGQIKPLLRAMIAAWPAVNASRGIVSWTKYEFVNTAIWLILFDHLDRGRAPSTDDPDLRAALSRLPVVDWHVVDRDLAMLFYGKSSNWTLADFDAGSGEGMTESNIFLFSLDWLGELRRRHAIPFSKGELARVALLHYQDWCLEKEKSGLSMLVPHPQALERFMAEHFFHFLGHQPYKAASLMELLPLYIQFLVEQGLLKSAKAEASLRSLRKLQVASVQLLGRGRDPNLAPAVERAWQ